MDAQLIGSQRVLRSLATLVLSTTLMAGAAQSLDANEITYRVAPLNLDHVGRLVRGTLKTDGTLGLLSANNIVSVSIEI